MIAVLINWIIIFASASIFGGGILLLTGMMLKKEVLWKKWDNILVTGIIFMTVYAQFFSVFYKVSAACCLSLCLLGVPVFILLIYKKNYQRVFPVIKWKNIQWILLFLCIFLIMIWTALRPEHYDTTVYHAQAIRWIEKYGVVPGLGNLHNRFAYNSAFMVLQALFSFRWELDQSLHAVNGFLAVLFVFYAIDSFQWRKEARASDLLKAVIILYIVLNAGIISSPSSDISTLLFVLWINAKWVEGVEREEKELLPYIFLCVASVFTITLKLSAVSCVLFIIYPLVMLIKRKSWKKIALSTIVCVITAVPFFIRNVIISGYLIYPYPQIDLFQVDWKMPASVLEHDAKEICVYGRESFDVGRYKETIFKWFPGWWQSLELSYRILFLISMFAMLFLVVYMLRSLARKNVNFPMAVLICAEICNVLVWIFGAPLPRYGWISMIILPCVAFPLAVKKVSIQRCTYFLRNIAIFGILCYGLSVKGGTTTLDAVMQQDYRNGAVKEVGFEGLVIYLPDGDDRTGYDPFPSILYPEQLKNIELRGDDFDSGFRIKSEKKGLHLRNDGYEW